MSMESMMAKAKELKDEKEKREAKEKESMAVTLRDLASIQKNPQLASLYQENASVGSDNLAKELPILKVHSANKSLSNELANGNEPEDGYFFYKPTGEQFQTIKCHILTIGKGFRSPGMEPGKIIFNQIIGGLIITEKRYLPFVMYLSGLKLSKMWDFGKIASKYTKAKPMGIPLFALTVKLSTEKVKNSIGGKSWIINFEIEKNEDGSPVLIGDANDFLTVKREVEIAEDMIASVVDAKRVKDVEEEPVTKLNVTSDEQKSDMPF